MNGLLSYRQAAALLGVDRQTTLKQLIKAGLLKPIKIGKRHYIPRGEIDRLIAGLSAKWNLSVE